MKNAGIYDDILYHEVPEYPNHPRMSRENRAAQFAPFAALTGLDEAMAETAEQNAQKNEPEYVQLDDQC